MVWPNGEVPRNPFGWLKTFATHVLLDKLKSFENQKICLAGEDELSALSSGDISSVERESAADTVVVKNQFQSEELRLAFQCCHPELSEVQQIALVLKIVFGLTTSEISSLSFSNEVTVAQRLVRAQSRVRELPDFFHELNSNSLQSRRTTVCKILYLLFNEGYFSHSRENQLDTYVCQEALALIQELCSNPKIASPEALGPTKNRKRLIQPRG